MENPSYFYLASYIPTYMKIPKSLIFFLNPKSHKKLFHPTWCFCFFGLIVWRPQLRLKRAFESHKNSSKRWVINPNSMRFGIMLSVPVSFLQGIGKFRVHTSFFIRNHFIRNCPRNIFPLRNSLLQSMNTKELQGFQTCWNRLFLIFWLEF